MGHYCDNIKINGGTVVCYAKKDAGIYSDATSVQITGGNVYSTGGSTSIGTTEKYVAPTDGENTLYLTKIQLPNITEEIQITNLITSDNIKYGIKDMYTTKDDENTVDINEGGMLYLYLLLGTRTITVQAGENTYSGTIETKEEESVVVLNKQ